MVMLLTAGNGATVPKLIKKLSEEFSKGVRGRY